MNNLSFKHYLKEDTQHKVEFVTEFSFNHNGTDYLTSSNKIDLAVEIGKKLKMTARFMGDTTIDFSVGVTLPNRHIDGPELETLQEKVNAIVQKSIKSFQMEVEHCQSHVLANGIPKFEIDYEMVIVYVKPGDTFSGIEKIITLSKEMHFNHCRNVKGNVLSLLKLNTSDLSLFSDDGSGDLEWITIVEKHFNGDKDVLECQEELIEAGYKEYAKL
jgi:hypothetical protein